jgi:hypothetical protein
MTRLSRLPIINRLPPALPPALPRPPLTPKRILTPSAEYGCRDMGVSLSLLGARIAVADDLLSTSISSNTVKSIQLVGIRRSQQIPLSSNAHAFVRVTRTCPRPQTLSHCPASTGELDDTTMRTTITIRPTLRASPTATLTLTSEYRSESWMR